MYKQNGKNWLLFISCFGKHYYFSCFVTIYPIDLVLPVSVRIEANSFCIKVQVQAFNILPLMNTLSDFEDEDG